MGLILASCGGGSENYKEACDAGDYEKAHKILNNLHDDLIKAITTNPDWYGAWYVDNGAEVTIMIATKYTTALEYIYKNEIRYLILNNDDFSERIIYLYNEMQPIGKKGGLSWSYASEEGCMRDMYNLYAGAVNSINNSVLELAINKGDKRLATLAITHYLEVIDKTGEEINGVYSNKDQVAAQEKFDNAMESGLFSEDKDENEDI